MQDVEQHVTVCLLASRQERHKFSNIMQLSSNLSQWFPKSISSLVIQKSQYILKALSKRLSSKMHKLYFLLEYHYNLWFIEVQRRTNFFYCLMNAVQFYFFLRQTENPSVSLRGLKKKKTDWDRFRSRPCWVLSWTCCKLCRVWETR